ncbi:MAG TPA: gamma-glutamyltransferase [Xanthobacteraceae bacterium]|nr:gamma-glutamyltransferase [Xanthobacteraceae bacterium]
MTTCKPGLSPNLSLRQRVRKPPAESAGGIVVSQNRLASEIGARVLADGGHAVDAAVATSFAVGVLEPWMSGIGGTGAMLVRDAASGEITVVDFGARAPAALDPKDYPVVGGNAGDLFGWPRVKDDRNLVGATAVCAPTTVAGVHAAHRRFGRKPWRDLVAQAIPLAEQGCVVDWHMLLEIATTLPHLARDPGCRSVFLPGGTPPVPPPAVAPEPVVRLPNPALGKTLAVLAEEGPRALYGGGLGRVLVEDIRAAGGCLTKADLAMCEPRVLAPRSVEHNGHRVSVLPELSGGPTLIRAFEELARRWTPSGAERPLDRTAFMAITEALREAWSDRFANMGDTATTAATSTTTHISVVDREGNMVALTQTLLSIFGSRFLSPSTGILLNNAINWFDPRPGGPNSMAPGKRALCNYCPAIMVGPSRSVAIGGSGGRKIMPAVFQLLVMLAKGMGLEEAFHAPRVDVSGGERVVVDRDLPEDVRAALAAKFDTLAVERTAYPAHFTIAGAVARIDGRNLGATEPHMPWSEAVSEDDL